MSRHRERKDSKGAAANDAAVGDCKLLCQVIAFHRSLGLKTGVITDIRMFSGQAWGPNRCFLLYFSRLQLKMVLVSTSGVYGLKASNCSSFTVSAHRQGR